MTCMGTSGLYVHMLLYKNGIKVKLNALSQTLTLFNTILTLFNTLLMHNGSQYEGFRVKDVFYNLEYAEKKTDNLAQIILY